MQETERSFSETKQQLDLIRERLLKIKTRIEQCEVKFPSSILKQ